MRFQHRTAVVTGAASGLGRAFAIALAQRGTQIALIDNQDCRETAAAIAALGAEVKYWYCDVTNETQVEEVCHQVIQQFAKVDFLLLCAGVHKSAPFEKITMNEWRRQIDVDLTGSFLFCRAFWGMMKQQAFGRILMLTGASGLFGDQFEAAYSSAKMALIGLVNSLSLEGQSYNICVNSLCAQVVTGMTAHHMADDVGAMFSIEAPVAAAMYLLGDSAPTGQHVLAAAGSVSCVRLAETAPAYFTADDCTPELVGKTWPKLSKAHPLSFEKSGEEQIVKWARNACREHGVLLE
ncbi:SDR family oxidoreductase [Shewanella yunxiaonensis]|uniref:SDR family oxidoreductase n=1 Tax=Shewanella yunxiaonensis TaxID=2829809 RepID=A0ABX7YVU4_9GAMM|nr:SDR family oxidoreductase [Shewanella yunxiaonensis]QUN06809.1 SDR family oxidoreductase [Shewanella yunxiaonensis]